MNICILYNVYYDSYDVYIVYFCTAVCPGCDKRIEGGQVSKALGKRYHKECFKCNGCGAEITSSFFVK